MIILSEKISGGRRRKRRQGNDLAKIEAVPAGRRPSVADQEIAKTLAGTAADTVGSILRDGPPDTASSVLSTGPGGSGLLGSVLRHDTMPSSVLAESEVNKALSAQSRFLQEGVLGTSARRLADSSVASLLASSTKGDATSRGGLAERTVREIEETQRRMSDLVLGRSFLNDRSSATIAAVQDGLARLGTVYASGSAATREIDRVYGALGAGRDRDRFLGRLAGLGSLARIAAGLADPGTDMQRRAGSLFTDAQRWLRPNAGANALEASLRTDYSDLFPTMRLPRRSEIDDVIDLSRTFIGSARQTEALGAMRNRLVHASVPWVQDDLPAASITAMGTLGGLRELVSASPPGDAEVVEALRTHLGDYREGDLPEPATLDDPIARTGYQLARGFDPTLTALPRAVVATMFSPFDSSDPVVDVDPDQVENAVRMLLKRLEKALRRFIADKLRELHGDNWFDALPSELRRSWTAGRQRDIENGRAPDEIIAYADLDHYRRIIEHPDRWERLFEPVFRDQAGIRETIKRIAVIRNPGAHFRAVTVEDLIILRAEGAHLSRWLGIRIGDS